MADESAQPDTLLERLTKYVTSGTYGNQQGGVDGGFLALSLAEARALVAAEIGAVTTVPKPIEERAIIECASDLVQRRAAPQGITQLAAPGTGDPQAVRVSRDPMGGAKLILRPFLGMGIG